MRVEKIELIGFKSFAERTVFNLHPGITCIVGPNGAGKSNIVDSFRWVLGEQSARSLRGEKMEEVIFNGSASKKPRGMSEVNLMLSFDSPEQGNGDSQSLTTVSRRLFRSGESEYLINRSQCRLRDIKDLFLDTGLEIKSYSILEQGRIGEILNSKPLDRRFLIEEVAGVMKYKARKAEAVSKLESSRSNLQRINDIVLEVKRQINALDRQVKKAERYKKLSAEIRSIELKIARRDYVSLKESLENLVASRDGLKEEGALVRAELNKLENVMQTKRIDLLEKEKFVDSLALDLQALEKEMAETERVIAVSNTESANLSEYLTRLIQQEADIVQKAGAIETRREELSSLEAGLVAEMGGLRDEISGLSESVRLLESDLSGKEELLESKRRDIFRTAEEISHVNNEIGRLLTSLDNLEKRYTSSLRESEAAQEQLMGVEAGLKEADEGIVIRNNDLRLNKDKRDKLFAEIEEHKKALDQARSTLSGTREELASASSRLDSLTEMMHEEFSKDFASEHLSVIASVGEVIDVDEAYEKAIENALSEKIRGLIVESFEEISAAMPVLKEKGIGRTVFVPLNLSSDAGGKSREHISPEHDSVVGKAIDLISIDPGRESLSQVIKGLLDGVIVVKDLPSAFLLLSQSTLGDVDNRPTFVTLEGETLEPSGAVTLGQGRGVLKKKREIRELDILVGEKREEMARLEETLTGMETVLQERRISLKDTDAVIIDTEKEISLLKLRAENIREEKDKVNRKLAYLNIEREELRKEEASLKEMAEEKEREKEALAARKSEAEQVLADIQETVVKDRERYERERSSITELRLSLNSAKERMDSLGKEMETSLEMLSELSEKQKTLLAEKEDIESRIRQCREDVEKNTGDLKGLVLKADSLRTAISENKEVIRTESEGLVLFEQQLKNLRAKVDSVTAALSEADVSLAEHRLKTENLTNIIRQNFDIEISTYESEPPISEDEERLSEIKAKIQELGLVNLGTLDEYEELKTRYEFLTKQQEDLNKSIAELEEAITKINSTTRRKLREAFEQLNAKFGEVFTLLFGGGKAELVMTDENNILDCGIDIIVQPPGKKLQNINLLSGGEKALTALSLLFASFLIKPSPLCILDEVDAALDESNIDRFAGMVRELSRDIQFIVVTHNRVTMEAAHHLYGITMEEPGVSKVISMQLVDS
jgi:chromosome segregation protein